MGMQLSGAGETQPAEERLSMQAHQSNSEVARRDAIDAAWRHGRAALKELNEMLLALQEAGADPNMRSDVRLLCIDLAFTTSRLREAAASSRPCASTQN